MPPSASCACTSYSYGKFAKADVGGVLAGATLIVNDCSATRQRSPTSGRTHLQIGAQGDDGIERDREFIERDKDVEVNADIGAQAEFEERDRLAHEHIHDQGGIVENGEIERVGALAGGAAPGEGRL